MARPYVFSEPTRLWSAMEGWRTFGVGETDPGGAWYETEGGQISGSGLIAGALKDLAEAHGQIELLGRQLESVRQDLQAANGERDAATARAQALSDELVTLKATGVPAHVPPPPAANAVPADWTAMPFLSKRALARRLTGDKTLSDKDAINTILATAAAPAD